MNKFKFSRESRLSSPSHFIFVLQQAQRTHISQITILSRPNSLKYPRIGLTIAKKYIKHAHERNRIKRLIRESFRLCQHELLPTDFIVIIKKEITNLNNYAVSKTLRKIWRRYYHVAHKF